MRLLAVGDVCGDIGCEEIRKKLSQIKRDKNIDFTVVNGENSATDNGISEESAKYLLYCGADVVTGGNHSLRIKSVYDFLDKSDNVLRPYNFKDCDIGRGYTLIDKGKLKVFVMNLSGTVFLEKPSAENPFICADKLLEIADELNAKIRILDFHAEATSEKIALARYLDGRVSCVFGTHTHVQTADNTVLKNGTGYITDLGMTGPGDSVLGIRSEIIINRLKSNDFSKFHYADGYGILNGCIFDIDENTGKTLSTERVMI